MHHQTLSDCEYLLSQFHKHKSMLALNSCESCLLLLPKITTTKTHLHLHLHLHPQQHGHHYVQLYFPPLKAHFKATLPAGSSSSLTTTVDFLMDSGGLSYEQANRVIRQVPTLLNNGGRNFRSVIAYFESIGLSKTHISKVLSKYPRVLASDVEKTLKPKIQMFLDFGFPESDIVDIIASKPTILHRSVETQMKPALDLIKSIVKTDDDLMIKTVKRHGLLLRSTYNKRSIQPNIDVLRQHGVPDSEIEHLIISRRLVTLMSTPVLFKSIVERIVSLGFKPETKKFLIAVSVMSVMKKDTWDSKIDLLKRLGWSEVQILDAFRRHPGFLAYSREKMKEGIGFFKESLNWDASVLSQYPVVLTFGLKTRVIPRYAVLKCLMSKGIIKQDTRFIHMLKLTETLFLSRYIFKYQDQLPYLYEVYKKK